MLSKIVLQGEQKKVLFLPPNNPVQVKGVAGSGKTTVALYRAKHLIETQNTLFKDADVVIFTYNKTLVSYIKAICPYINGGYQQDSDEIKPRSVDGLNVKVYNFHSWAYRFLNMEFGITLQGNEQSDAIRVCKGKILDNNKRLDNKSVDFLLDEISWIKGKLLSSLEEYYSVKRVGRGASDRVTREDKRDIWNLFLEYEKYKSEIGKNDFDDYAILCLKVIDRMSGFVPPFTHIIIDEAQDLNKAQMMVISKLVSSETNSITIIADAAQRIYKSGFTWTEVGINVRGGRTIEFKRNYRNGIHIARAALSLLENEPDKSEFSEATTAPSSGDKPIVVCCSDQISELKFISKEINSLLKTHPNKSIAVLHRTNAGLNFIKTQLDQSNIMSEIIKSKFGVDYNSNSVKICTMPSVKGLEFDIVFLFDLDDNMLPYYLGFSEPDDEIHISTERRLLFVCMTRAKERIYLVTGTQPSRFIKEIKQEFLDYKSPDTKSDKIDINKLADDDDLPF